jgi:hypothetical protein
MAGSRDRIAVIRSAGIAVVEDVRTWRGNACSSGVTNLATVAHGAVVAGAPSADCLMLNTRNWIARIERARIAIR